MADAIDATLANHEVFMQRHAHDAKVASPWYKKADRIPSLSNSDTDSPYFIPLLIKVLFWSSGFRVATYLQL